MKIVLVVYKYDVSVEDPCCYPLGLMYVSTWLKVMGNSVKILNYNLQDYDFKEEIVDCNLIGFTGFEKFKKQILRDEKICKKASKKTMIGGALPTFNSIPEFQGTQFKGEVPGMNANFYHNCIPDYEGIGIHEYIKRHQVNYMGVLTTLGCPYNCTFCAQTCNFMMRPVEDVMMEIDYYKMKYGCTHIAFNDNTFNINKQRFLKFCANMYVRDMKWSAAIRCAPFDEYMAKAAKDCGCENLVVGVESLNQKKLNRMNKQIKSWQIIRTLDLLEKYEIPYHGNILVGFEWETFDDIQADLSIVPGYYNIFPAMVQPFIGTKNAHKRKITEKQYSLLNDSFELYAEKHGMQYSAH